MYVQKKFHVLDGRHLKRSGTNESPGGFHLDATASHQVKEFGHDCLGGQQRQPELTECAGTRVMPPIFSVEERQSRAGVDQSITGHGAAASAPESPALRSPPGA